MNDVERERRDADGPSFPVAFCPACDRDVLVGGTPADDGGVDYVCVDCGAPLGPVDDAMDWIDADHAADMGYTVGHEKQPHGKRGCRDGSCGVRQPDDESN